MINCLGGWNLLSRETPYNWFNVGFVDPTNINIARLLVTANDLLYEAEKTVSQTDFLKQREILYNMLMEEI